MFRQKPTFWLIFFLLASLLLLVPLRADEDGVTVPDAGSDSDSDSDSEGIEELLALDDEAENEERRDETSQRSSEADVLTKAQRIVLELNDDNAKRVIGANEFVLVLGYAPWCPRSAELMPRFAEAANSLNALNSPLLMAKLDADRHPKAASALEIRGFPTLALFVNGSSQLYNGGFSAEDIVIWAMKKTGIPVVRINTISEAEKFLQKHHTYVIGYFEKLKGIEHDEFTKAASADTEIQFVETSNVEVAGVLFPEIKPSNNMFVGIVKSEPERYTVYEGASFERETLLQFVNFNKFALVTKLTEMNSPSVYSSPVKLQVMVFAQEADFDKLLEPIRDVARKFKSKILFMYIDITDENLAKPFLTLYGLEDSKNTVVAAFDNSMSSKFLLESDPTRDNIEDFCSKLLQGTQDQYFKSQPIPDNTDASIHVVVGRTFEDLVVRSPKNVLLEVYTPWCLACDKTSKQVEKLAKHFKGSDLVFARFDAAVNEHPKLNVDDYPTLLLYRAGDKETPVKLSTKASLKDLAGSINKHLKAREKVIKDEL